jgi:hypothetical protein
LRFRAKSFFQIFAAFRRHIYIYWAKLVRNLLKRGAIFRLYCFDPQRSL